MFNMELTLASDAKNHLLAQVSLLLQEVSVLIFQTDFCGSDWHIAQSSVHKSPQSQKHANTCVCDQEIEEWDTHWRRYRKQLIHFYLKSL